MGIKAKDQASLNSHAFKSKKKKKGHMSWLRGNVVVY